jgi:hypothetical protein
MVEGDDRHEGFVVSAMNARRTPVPALEDSLPRRAGKMSWGYRNGDKCFGLWAQVRLIGAGQLAVHRVGPEELVPGKFQVLKWLE